MTILVFDSGIGGLSVLREARMLMHNHQFLYVGDDAGFPYGDWDGDALTKRALGIMRVLIERYNPKLAIIACNTASTQIMPALRDAFDIPFVGIVPAIKPAAERTASGYVTILATPGTIKRPYLKSLIQQHASHVNVNLVGATKLAKLSESHMQGEIVNADELKSEILPCFVEQNDKRTDIITLGCTHYPFLVNEMRKHAPWPVDWIDPAEAVARQAQRELARSLGDNSYVETDTPIRDSINTAADIAIMTSGSPSNATTRLLSGLGLQLIPAFFPTNSA